MQTIALKLKIGRSFSVGKKQKVPIMLILTVVTLVCILVGLIFLPDAIPLHFGANGAGTVANKYFLLLFVPVPAILFWAACRKLK